MARALTAAEKRARQDRFKALVRERRLALLEELGPVCALCGDTELDPFHFDHVGGWKQWTPEKKNQLTRINEVWRDHTNWKYHRIGGPVRVLCAVCNGWDGAHRQNEKRRARLAEKRRRRNRGRRR